MFQQEEIAGRMQVSIMSKYSVLCVHLLACVSWCALVGLCVMVCTCWIVCHGVYLLACVYLLWLTPIQGLRTYVLYVKVRPSTNYNFELLCLRWQLAS